MHDFKVTHLNNIMKLSMLTVDSHRYLTRTKHQSVTSHIRRSDGAPPDLISGMEKHDFAEYAFPTGNGGCFGGCWGEAKTGCRSTTAQAKQPSPKAWGQG
jgi:hypothetical protein